jgi:hypothetical protein
VLEGPTPSGYGGGPPDRLPGMLGRGRVRFGATRYHRNGRGWRPLRNPYFMGIKSGRFGDLASLCWQGVRELAIQGAESEQPGRSNLPLFPEPRIRTAQFCKRKSAGTLRKLRPRTAPPRAAELEAPSDKA